MYMKKLIKQLLREGLEFKHKIKNIDFNNEGVKYYTQDDGDEYDVVKVTPDDYHQYANCDGITYELSSNGGDEIVYVSEIEHTGENMFYGDQVERYIKYLENGGMLESFPVNVGNLGSAYSLEKMCEYLSESENFDLMYDLVNVDNSKAHISLYDAIDSLSYDSESYGINDKILYKIRNKSDLDKYYGENYLSQFNKEDIEDYNYYWEPEYYYGFKKILEHWEDVKELGITKVYVDTN